MCGKLKYPFPMGKVHTCVLLSILNPLRFWPGELWQHMMDFRESRMDFAEEVGPLCFIGSTDNKSWLQLFFSAYHCDMVSSDIALPGRCDGRQVTTTSACVVSHYGKKPVWILQEFLRCGDSCLQVLLASCFPLCMAHFWYFLLIFPLSPSYTSSFGWVHTLQYHFRRTWLMKIPLRAPCLELEWGGKCQKHCQRLLILSGRMSANTQ